MIELDDQSEDFSPAYCAQKPLLVIHYDANRADKHPRM